MKTKTHKKLILFFAALLLIPTTFVYADYKLGIQYFKQGKYVESAGEFQAEVDMAPNYDYGYYMLGMCYLKLKKYDQSIDNFNKAIELSQEKFDYHYGLAQVYLKTKKYYKVTGSDSSQVFVDRYKKLHPEADVFQLDAKSLDINRNFDCIYSNKVLLHLTKQECSE